MLAQCDVVHDEGLAFAERLAKESESPVSLADYEGVSHGFLLQVLHVLVLVRVRVCLCVCVCVRACLSCVQAAPDVADGVLPMLQSCRAPSKGLHITKGEQAIAQIVEKLHAAYARVGNEP